MKESTGVQFCPFYTSHFFLFHMKIPICGRFWKDTNK